MKVLIYTRFEGNTGGDQKQLEMLLDVLNTQGTEDIEFNLIIAHDSASAERANASKTVWEESLLNRFIVFLHETGPGKSSLRFCMPANQPRIKQLCADPDVFIMAGWSHQQSPQAANHVAEQLKIPKITKILLCATPERKINEQDFADQLIAQDYTNVYSLQMGLNEPGGLPVAFSVTKERMEAQESREAWLSHLTTAQSINKDEKHPIEWCSKKGVKQDDHLIVIYCSKDIPTTNTNIFLDKIKEKEYPVILIGANNENKENWVNVLSAKGFNQIYTVLRTIGANASSILMRGLRDAQYAMATGTFSILEAKKLGISHCDYLCPAHQRTFWNVLGSATEDELTRAFARGEQSLQQLPSFLKQEFQSECITKLDSSNSSSATLSVSSGSSSSSGNDNLKPESTQNRSKKLEWYKAKNAEILKTKEKKEDNQEEIDGLNLLYDENDDNSFSL